MAEQENINIHTLINVSKKLQGSQLLTVTRCTINVN